MALTSAKPDPDRRPRKRSEGMKRARHDSYEQWLYGKTWRFKDDTVTMWGLVIEQTKLATDADEKRLTLKEQK